MTQKKKEREKLTVFAWGKAINPGVHGFVHNKKV